MFWGLCLMKHVKPPPTVLASHMGFESWLLHQKSSSLLMSWKSSRRWLRHLGPFTHMQDLGEAWTSPGYRSHLGSAPADQRALSPPSLCNSEKKPVLEGHLCKEVEGTLALCMLPCTCSYSWIFLSSEPATAARHPCKDEAIREKIL